MEESNKDQRAAETPIVTPTAGAGESLTAVPPPLPPADFTKVDNNLTGIGFFSASNKRSRKAVEKTTIVVDHGVEHHISILPSAKYGLPITQDQDYWLALMKLVSEHVHREGKLVNPFNFTTAQLTKMLGQVHSGKNWKAVEEWLGVMVSTTVEGGAYNILQKSWYNEKIHAVDRVVAIGKKLPDGTVADKNYIWFSQWQLDNINAGNLIAIELNTYTQLETNIARNLVPHLQEWLFASQHQGRFEKQYEDICQLLGVRSYPYISKIQEKLGPALNELVAHGYISKWAIEPMSTRKAYKLVLWHGRKYHSDRQARLDRNAHSRSAQTQLPVNERVHRPRQKPLQLVPEVNAEDLAALTSRGVGETAARKLLSELPAGFDFLATLEWGDQQIAGQPGKFTNPPGFYISLLRDRFTPPATFESSRQKAARKEAEFARQRELERLQAERDAEERAARQQAESALAALSPEQAAALRAKIVTDLSARFPKIDWRSGNVIQEASIRAGMLHELQQLQMQLTIPPEPGSVAAILLDNLRQRPS